MRNTLAAIAIITASLGAAHAADDEGAWDFYVRAQPQATLMTASGDLSYEKNGLAASKLTTGDLGLGEREIAPGIDVMIDPPILFGLAVGGFQFSTSGSTRQTQPVSFGGQTFAAGLDIGSDLEVTDLYGEIYVSPPFTRWDIAGVALGIGAHHVQAQARLNTVGREANLDESFVVPVGSLRAYVSPLDWFEVEAMAHGMRIVLGDQSATYVNAQIQAACYPIDYIGVIAGYRHVLYDLHVDAGNGQGASVSLTLSGPYAGVAARF